MKNSKVKDYCLTNFTPRRGATSITPGQRSAAGGLEAMKNICKIIPILLLLASCGNGLTEKAVRTYENGQPLLVYVYNKDNQWIASKEYYENGMLKMEGTVANDVRQGNWTAYFPDGKVQSTGVYENGLRVGPSKVYHENGHLWMDGSYVDDHKCGEWVFYDEQGYEIDRRDFGPCD